MHTAALKAGSRGLLIYSDAEGRRTERKIRVLRRYQSGYGREYVRAYCERAGEERTFRLDRVLDFRPESGGSAGGEYGGGRAGGGAASSRTRTAAAGDAFSGASGPGWGSSRSETSARPEAAPRSSEGEADDWGPFAAVFWLIGMLFKGVFLFLTRLYGPLCLFGFVLVIGIKILDVGGSVIFAAAESRFPAPVAYVPPAPRAVPPHVPRPAVSTVPSVPKAAVSASVPRQTVPKPPPPRPKNARELRADKFTRHTGVSDPGVLKIYETADRDGNGNLSWGELEDFQKDLMRKVRYKHNTTALRPDEFLKQGGGDCEDWSLFTCGLLRYWGIEAFVGTFTDPKDSSGHAVAMVFSREKIEGKVFYEARNAFTRQNTRIPDGWYAPIDYEFVGALSDAVSPGSVFDGWYVPERIYGLTM